MTTVMSVSVCVCVCVLCVRACGHVCVRACTCVFVDVKRGKLFANK